nr:sulfide:quinone oxidoreductase, mitochondrial-like [Onthophagus taurus]
MFSLLTIKYIPASKWKRFFSISQPSLDKYSCKVLIVGGGAGGCSLGAKLSRIMHKSHVIILEPSNNHYYQGWFTLCGAGIKKINQTVRPMKKVLPKNVVWIQDAANEFNPEKNTVTTRKGVVICYDVLVLATGVEMSWEKIPGLLQALEYYQDVGSIFSPKYAEKTYYALNGFKEGNLVFTYPKSPVKCAGAPLKICYLLEDLLRLKGKRQNAYFTYHTPYPYLYTVKYYEKTLIDIAERRKIDVVLQSNLVEVVPDKCLAVFENIATQDKCAIQYSILHATPPMYPPCSVRSCKSLVNKIGYVKVNKYSMQHLEYPNIFGVGDCTAIPNAKTAAACASQVPVIFKNIQCFLAGEKMCAFYDGYASCPIVTAIGKCVLAEFDYSYQPKETFPFSQNRELWMTYIMKKEVMPRLYWNLMMKVNFI